jgi:hypothetical protein
MVSNYQRNEHQPAVPPGRKTQLSHTKGSRENSKKYIIIIVYYTILPEFRAKFTASQKQASTGLQVQGFRWSQAV